MKEGMNKPSYIIADDFTGANDIGVALASSGVATKVLLAAANTERTSSHVGVICTDSRDLEIAEAKSALKLVSQSYQLAQQQPLLIKKVDSTLRGNIGSEIEALLETGYKLAIVAIAAPFSKRKTINGICYVNDIPLAETEFASDPKSPIHSSRVEDIIKSQTTCETAEYLHPEQKNTSHLQSFVQFYEAGTEIIVCDTQSHDDLYSLYNAASQLNVPVVFVTTGELTHALVNKKSNSELSIKTTDSPVLAIIGSMSAMTLKQSQYLIDNEIAKVVDLELDELLSENHKAYLENIAFKAAEILRTGDNCVLRSCKSIELRHELKAIAAKYELSQKQLAEHVRECLAELAYQIIEADHQQLGGMILCGGDIAIATAQRLNAPEYQIGGIVADCVPWGLLDSELTPFPIFTKAGGFGNPATFSQVIQHLQKEVR